MKPLALLFAILWPCFPQTKQPIIPVFLQDVYAISPYGDFTRMNPLYWADSATANAVAGRIDATPVLRDTTPQTGPALKRWHVSEVAQSLISQIPPGRQASGQLTAILLDLPAAKMWAVHFVSGCEINAGYLADYYKRNPEKQFPGLADKYVRQIIAGECSIGTAAFARKAYPSVFADGKQHVIKEPKK